MLPKPQLDDDAPWKKRYRIPPVQGRLARRNPARGLLLSNQTGKYERYAWDVSTGRTWQLTDRPAGTLFAQISPDGRWVYFLDDKQGNEYGHLKRLPFEGGSPVDMTPDLPLYTTALGGVSGSGNRFGLTVPAEGGFDFYILDQDEQGPASAPHRLYHSETLAHGPAFSQDGSVAVWAVTRPGMHAYGLLSFDTASGKMIAELWEGTEDSVEIEFECFSPLPGDNRLLATSDRSGNNRPLIWDARTGDRTDLDTSRLEGEVAPWEWSPDARRVLLCQTARATQRLWMYQLDNGAMTRLDHPEGTYVSATFLENGDIALTWTDSTHAHRIVVLDGQTGSLRQTLRAPEEAPAGQAWRSVTFTSSDGQEIQMWVATPDGAGPWPAIMDTHGGPTAAQFNVFRPASQCWLDHGFAFCSVNYRGSTTFGRDFQRKIWGNLGHWEVEDMVAARTWLVNNGIARPDQILLTGWSYGGYLTLHALGVAPDLWAGGMGGVVVADWVSQYEDENEMLRGYDLALFGGTLEEKREQYVKSSPITYLDRLKAPVLIIQGRNDTRDPPRQVELYEAKARELGKPVEVIWFDTGHAGSAADRELAIKHQEQMLEFAYRVLGAATSGRER